MPCTAPPSAGASMDVGRGPGAHKSKLQAQAQAEAMWEARGFQGASGGAPCVLTTVTTPAHSETQHKAPPRQSRLINKLHHSEDGHEASFQTHIRMVDDCGWARAPDPTCR